MPTGLQSAIRGHVFERGQSGFEQAARIFDPQFDSVRPDAVARPRDADDVRDAIQYCEHKGIPVRARSGGHSYAGYSTAARRCRARPPRPQRDLASTKHTGTATIGAGALLIDVTRQNSRSLG